MTHILDPKRLASEHDYCAALDELEALNEIDDGPPAGWRFEELALLIHEYESTMHAPGLSWPISSA